MLQKNLRETGSGSLEKESPVCIVAMEKEEKTRFVHQHRLGKRQRHAYKAGQALTQRVIPALHMGRFSRLFSYSGVLLLRDHRLVGCERVGEAMPLTIEVWNALPQALARPFTPIPNGIANHLTRLAAEGDPNPGVVGFFKHKRAICSSNSNVVEVGSSGSGASKVVRKGGS